MATYCEVEKLIDLLPPYEPRNCADCETELRTAPAVSACLHTGVFLCAEHTIDRINKYGCLAVQYNDEIE